jgi:hypothetical protein
MCVSNGNDYLSFKSPTNWIQFVGDLNEVLEKQCSNTRKPQSTNDITYFLGWRKNNCVFGKFFFFLKKKKPIQSYHGKKSHPEVLLHKL